MAVAIVGHRGRRLEPRHAEPAHRSVAAGPRPPRAPRPPRPPRRPRERRRRSAARPETPSAARPADPETAGPELLRSGVPAEAKVMSVVDERTIGPVTRSRLTLQISPRTGPPFEVTTRVAFPTPAARARVKVGGTVPVRYDRDDRTRIVVDLPPIDGRTDLPPMPVPAACRRASPQGVLLSDFTIESAAALGGPSWLRAERGRGRGALCPGRAARPMPSRSGATAGSIPSIWIATGPP